MGTRANICLINEKDNTKKWLYRHWDGYPTETGNDVATCFNIHNFNFNNIHTSLLNSRNIETPDDKIYENTHCEHADIQWLYELIIMQSGKLKFQVSEYVYTNSTRKLEIRYSFSAHGLSELFYSYMLFQCKKEEEELLHKRIYYNKCLAELDTLEEVQLN